MTAAASLVAWLAYLMVGAPSLLLAALVVADTLIMD